MKKAVKNLTVGLGLATLLGGGILYKKFAPNNQQVTIQNPSALEKKINATLPPIQQNTTNLLLQRTYTQEQATMGELYKDTNNNGKIDSEDTYLADTLELPFRNNRQNISCIPEGTYKMTPRISKKLNQPHFQIHTPTDITGRSGIMMHQGTTTWNSLGCLLVGKKTEEGYSLERSSETLAELRKEFEKETDLRLTITSNYKQ